MHDLHILFLPSWYPTAHSPLLGTFFREQAMALHRAGFKVGVIYPDIRSTRGLSVRGLKENHFQTTLQYEDSIPVYRYCGWNLPKFKRVDLIYVHQMLRLMKKYIANFGRPDVLHAQASVWGGVAAERASRRFGIPYVITEHLSLFARKLISDWQAPKLRNAFANASDILSVSKALVESIEPYTGGKRVRIVPNVVDTNYFAMPEKSRESKVFRLLIVAFLTPGKGLNILLSAFSKAFNSRNEVVLEIGGDGPQRNELEKQSQELGLAGQVRFLGQLSRSQVRDAMWRAHAFVLPSYVETFGVVLIEAMSTGLPVVAMRCGGPEEFVTPEVGLLAEAGNVDDLAAALQKIHASASLYNPDSIREYTIKNYSEEKLVERLSLVYQDVLNRSSGIRCSPENRISNFRNLR